VAPEVIVAEGSTTTVVAARLNRAQASSGADTGTRGNDDGGEQPPVVRYEPSKAQLQPERVARRDRIVHTTLAISLPIAIFALWELSAHQAWVDERFYGRPSGVFTQARELLADGTLIEQIWITVRRLVVGYVLGATSGIVVGLALSQFRLLRAAFEPLLQALYVIPKLAILPLLLLLLGLGEGPKIAFIAIGTFFILAFSTLTAATMVPSAFHEVATSYGLSRWQRFRWLVLPHSLPQIVAALRLASGIAVLLVVAAEFVQANDGLGYLTWHAWELFMADRMYLGIVTIALLGVTFSYVVGLLRPLLVRWADDQ
jgi:sulfonate transport system permease protein